MHIPAVLSDACDCTKYTRVSCHTAQQQLAQHRGLATHVCPALYHIQQLVQGACTLRRALSLGSAQAAASRENIEAVKKELERVRLQKLLPGLSQGAVLNLQPVSDPREAALQYSLTQVYPSPSPQRL